MINTVIWANKVYKDCGSSKFIDASILYEVLDAALNETVFSDDQLLSYYSTLQEVEIFISMMKNFVAIESHVPLVVEYVLFGLGYEDQEKLSKDQAQEFEEEFNYISCKTEIKKHEIIKFIKDARAVIDKAKSKILKAE